MNKGPVLIDLEGKAAQARPAEAPPVPDADAPPTAEGRAMQVAARLAARRPSLLVRWFWGLLLAILGTVLSVGAWDFAAGLVARMPVTGYAVSGLFGLFALVLLVIGIREVAAFARLSRMDALHRAARDALSAGDLAAARAVSDGLLSLYKGRVDTSWGQGRMRERAAEQFDAAGLLALAEIELLAPLDQAAAREVELAARRVATVTAIVPLAFADVFAALTANLRMIRRIAEIYGGRAGTIGSWRLARAVMTHLVATGAVAVGDDLIGSVAGGSVMSRISRRFGEGVVNGALTARVGVAAMEVCRPLPFDAGQRPSVTGLVKRALAGLFSRV